MSQKNTPALDLSALPQEIRARVEQALLKLPPEQRMQMLQHGSPLLNKLLERVQQSAPRTSTGGPPPMPAGSERPTAARPGGMELPAHAPHHVNPRSAPRGHYNDTIRPGDGASQRWLAVGLLLVVLMVAWFQF